MNDEKLLFGYPVRPMSSEDERRLKDQLCNVKIGAGPVMQCQACGRGENGKHADDCAWMRGEANP